MADHFRTKSNMNQRMAAYRSNLLLFMIHEAFHITTLPTNSSKIRHRRDTER